MATFAYTAINSLGIESPERSTRPTSLAAREQLRVRGLLARDAPGAAVGG